MRPVAIITAAFLFEPLLAVSVFAKEAVKFNRDIRPILSDTCFHCHGFDPKTREGGLRLDVREEALKAGKSGKTAIVPGKPMESEIIVRIFAEDESDRMPPEEAHKVLSPEQKELFRRWVEEGAQYEAHWAYTPLVQPKVPEVKDVKKVRRNEVDAFFFSELEKHQIDPSPEASKRDLLRRLSLDLTGLPPTPDEMSRFLSDNDPDAYEKQVIRLLRSPHYGERMAVWWLDVARFTDTVGYHGDQNQRIFPYRDYVIRSFNENKSFRDFTIEQLAGDLLPNPTKEQLVATGFNRLNMMTREGGAQPKEYLAKYGAERARTVATTWLGSTFGCAECHDHKFDPISQRDFYSLQAYFADVKQWGVYSDYKYSPEPELRGFNNDYPFPPEIEVESPYRKKRASKLRGEMLLLASTTVNQQSANAFAKWREKMTKFLQQYSDGWEVAVPVEVKSLIYPPPKSTEKTKEVKISVIDDDGRVLFMNEVGDTTQFRLRPNHGVVASVKVDLLPMKIRGGSILRKGGEGEMKLRIMLARRDAKGKEEKVDVVFADGHPKRPNFSNGAELIGIINEWRTLDTASNQKHVGVAFPVKPVALAEGEELIVTLGGNQAAAIKVSTSPLALLPTLGEEPGKTLANAFKEGSAEAVKLQQESFLLSAADPDHQLEEALQQHRDLFGKWLEQRGGKAWTMVTKAVDQPLTVRVLPRGNWMDESGDITPPSTPEFLPKIAKPANRQRQNRLDLAQWVCSNENPITARAVVNRLWKEFFGNGLSAVVDDLGAQGEPPSHPELLDWLACEFRESGWDIQHVIKLMVLSHTYRQSSNLRPELRDLDPDNRLLASQNPRRLDAEFVRDNALYIAGLLNLEDIGGPSVKPYQPPGYYDNLQFPSRDYVADVDDRQWRRGLYMHWQRTFLHPMLANFDAQSREECIAFRPQSNTPQQALTLLNDPTFVEASRVLAERLLKLQVTGDGKRLDESFQIVLGRTPTDDEKSGLLDFVAKQREIYRNDLEAAVKLISTGLKKRDESLDPSELAAWTSVARVLLNLHETITRY